MGTTVTALAGQALRAKSLLAALALALLVSVGAATDVGAERPPSGGDSHQQGCRAIYDAAARLRAEYLKVALTNPGSSRLDEINAEGRILGQDWIALKCRDRYGSIAHLMVNPFAPIVDPVHAITADPVHDIFSDPASTLHPLLSESSPRITLGDINLEPATAPKLAPVAAPLFGPELEEDEVVTIQPVPAPVAEVIVVPELAEDDVVTIQPVPVPVGEVIVVPELEEDEVVTTQPVPAPVADEIVVPELAEDEVVTTEPAPPADEQP